MLTVTFAFVVATALLLLSARTRWMGAVGVFVLLCINPLVFTALLLLGGIAHWLIVRGRPCNTSITAVRSTSNENGFRASKAVVPLLALAACGALLLSHSQPTEEGNLPWIDGTVRSAPRPEVIVLRTPGGLLDVSGIESTEIFDATLQHKVFGVNIGETMPRIRVPAVYRYHIELAPEWRVVRADGVFTVVAPCIKPTLPVAVDFEGIQKDVAGNWILLPFTSGRDLDLLERSLTVKLAQKASSKDYVDRQREAARETVREFVRKWLVEQTRWKSARYEDIRVLFEDEPAGYIAPVSI